MKELFNLLKLIVKVLVTSVLLCVIGFSAYGFKHYANCGDTSQALAYLFTMLLIVIVLPFIWKSSNK